MPEKLDERGSRLLQSYPSSQSQFFCFEVWFRAPLAEVLRMHTAVKPDAQTVLANQAEPTRQAGAFGTTKLKALPYFLYGESVDHCPDATHTGVSKTSQEGGRWPLFRGVTKCHYRRHSTGWFCVHTLLWWGHVLLIAGRACVCHPR